MFDFWEPFDDVSAWTSIGSLGIDSSTPGILEVTDLDVGELLYITGPAGDHSDKAGFAVRARALQGDVSNDLGPVGWHLNPSTGLRYDISAKQVAPGNRIRRFTSFTKADDLATGGGVALPIKDQWYVYEATVEGAVFRYTRDGSLLLSATDNTLSGGKVFINGECLAARWDWLLIRPFLSPEPTASLAAEDVP